MNDSRGITVSQIASECRQIKVKEGKLGLVVVDYLQMMAEDSGGNRSYELGDVARGLYKMAGELDVPVLALSQISRGVEGRQNKRPIREILTLLGVVPSPSKNTLLGDIENSPSNDVEQSKIPPSKDIPSKTRRHKGLGSGSIQWKTITLHGKDYPQA